ncbi:MAG: hypothetical protein KDK27_15110 [Leptospiraceae bacterium]|nr:hypothetical protein [Leptospiraceae bacterium]
MRNHRKWIVLPLALLLAGSLMAQPRTVEPETEQEEFPDLQRTEALQEANILDAYTRLGELGWLVQMAQQDRRLQQLEEENPLNFEYTFRYIKFTPRNTYIRYVKEDPQFLLNTFGPTEQILNQIKEKVELAKTINVPAEAVTLDKGRDGIELTQYDFIYSNDPDQRRAIGSRRKSLTLFFDRTNNQADTAQQLQLSMVVTKIVENDFRRGVSDTELIIDPAPLDPKDDIQMSDILILHRYNQKPTNVILLGLMHNTSTNPHRLEFKQEFYVKLLDHFFRLFRLVANYASKDDNDYNEEVLQKLEQSMSY